MHPLRILTKSLVSFICVASLGNMQTALAATPCPSADSPLMAIYQNISGLDSNNDNPAKNTGVLILWREGGQNGRVAVEKTKTSVTEIWNRTTNGQLRTVRLFDQYERAVEFEPTGSPDNSEAVWRQRFYLVDPASLSRNDGPTSNSVGINIKPESAEGSDLSCNNTSALGNLTGNIRTDVEWHDSLQIPMTYRKIQWLAGGPQQVNWKLIDWNTDSKEIAQRFEQWDRYDAVDFADIGDNESDPFLARMINLGFIEHGGKNFYDSEGRVLSGQLHQH